MSQETKSICGVSIQSINDVNVIIIGAGISGLTAAYELIQHDQGLRFLVLEAKKRVGGRTYSTNLETVNKRKESFDLGGLWVSSLQLQLMVLLKKLDIKTYRQYSQGFKAGKAGNAAWKTFKEFPIFGPIYCRYELQKFISKLEMLAQQMTMSNPMIHPEAEELDRITMDSYISQNLTTTTARDIIRTVIRMQFGTEASDFSALYFLAYCFGTCGFLNQFSTEFTGARELRIQGGAQQISKRLVQKIGADNVILEELVVEIQQDELSAVVVTSQNRKYSAEHVIVAIPPSEMLKINFQPPLPAKMKRLLRRYHMGNVTQFVLTYKEPFWRTQGYSGDILDYGGKKNKEKEKYSPLTMACDVTTQERGFALMGQLSGVPGIYWSEMKADIRKRAILDCLASLWGNKAYDPLDFVEHNWTEDRFIEGGPSYVLSPGNMTYFKNLWKPFLRVHWAGTETSPTWTGYMNGAVQAGCRAAVEVLYEIRPQSIKATDIINIGKGFERIKYVVRRPSYEWLISMVPIVIVIALVAYKQFRKL